jgi:hypothetical protein
LLSQSSTSYLGTVSLILHVNFGSVVLLPQRCSLIINGDACGRSPSFIIYVNDRNDQYMIGVVCEEHMKQMEKQLESMQEIAKVPEGSIQFQPLKTVSTNCIRGSDEDYMEVESNRKYINM